MIVARRIKPDQTGLLAFLHGQCVQAKTRHALPGLRREIMFQVKNHMTRNRLLCVSILCAAVVQLSAQADSDSLYLADTADNTVKRFNASTGVFQGAFVTPILVPSNGSEPD